jgi:serine/threonine protein kinase
MSSKKHYPRIFEDVPTNITEEYELLELLGEGNFAKVRKARHKKTKKEVAVKMIEKEKIVTDRKQLLAMFNEIVIMRNIQHPNIIKLIEVYETEDKLCLIMQLVTGGLLLVVILFVLGELFDRIAELGSYSERDASLTILSVLRAIKYLHDKGIAHRDLKVYSP